MKPALTIKDQLGPWQHEHHWGVWTSQQIVLDDDSAVYDGEVRRCRDCDAVEYRMLGLAVRSRVDKRDA